MKRLINWLKHKVSIYYVKKALRVWYFEREHEKAIRLYAKAAILNPNPYEMIDILMDIQYYCHDLWHMMHYKKKL